VPEAFGARYHISEDERAVFEYHASIREGWDGRAALAFTDGTRIGAMLDRNGLRPARYVVTKDDRVVLASEAGVLDIPPADIKEKGRLAPGRMLLVDTRRGRLLRDTEIKAAVSRWKPYRRWLEENRIDLRGLLQPPTPVQAEAHTLAVRQRAFGYTLEDLKMIITGNVNLFGATAGEAFICGMAGERFAVRNSGAVAVVEGVGDHGCEYMTGGRVIILGDTGVNFAAGMSGGIAYVLDQSQLFDTRCNLEMVDVEPVSDKKDVTFLRTHIDRHVKYTGSALGRRILDQWDEMLPLFVRVMPIDYRKALERMRAVEERNTETTPATEEVFHG